MGSINIDNTGTGADVTLSSDGTSLLLGGTAIGGGADLYAANPSSATDPVASGANAVAIGDGATASGSDSYAIGNGVTASADRSIAIGEGTNNASQSVLIGFSTGNTVSGSQAVEIGRFVTASGTGSLAIGGSVAATSNYASAIGRNSSNGGSQAVTGAGAMALGGSYASGADSFAAAIANNTSSYGATGANSIAIGKQAKASSNEAVAIGGNFQTASALYASTIGGTFNTNQGSRAIIAGGQSNTISTAAQYGVIVGGNNNNVTGDRGVIVGGANNEANAFHTFATGEYAKAAEIGKLARATGRFSADGDAQGGQFILRADTTDATATVLTTNNSTAASTNQIVAASDTCITFDGTITAMQNGAQAYASWKIEGLLVNDGGTTTLANSATTVISNSSSWGMALSADNTNNALAITCTGEAAHNIRWVANIRTTEVTYA